MDCLKDSIKALEWNGANEVPQPTTLEFRKTLSFLEDQQFQILCELNVKSIQQLLNISLQKLLQINLKNDQLQSIYQLLQNEMSNGSKPLNLSGDEIQSLKNIQEELEKLDANDDDDEQALVIDETISVSEESNINNVNERSLDVIEENFSKIKNIKVPQTRAAIKGVKTELSEIIAELNGKESRLLRQLQRNKQSNSDKNEISNGIGTDDIVTTTSKALLTNLPSNNDDETIALPETGKQLAKPAKKGKAARTVKRRRNNLKNNSNIKKPNADTSTSHTDENTTTGNTTNSNTTSCIESPQITPQVMAEPIMEVSTLKAVSQNSHFDVAPSAHILENTIPKNASTMLDGQGILLLRPSSIIMVHEDIATCSSSPPVITKPLKKRPQTRQFNLSTTKNAVILDVSESKFITASPEQLFTTSNVATIGDLPLIQPNTTDETETFSKEYTDCKVVQKISKHLKSFSAAQTQPKLQPTVMIKKLPTPMRLKEYNVDADSTTTSIDHIGAIKVNTIENAEANPTSAHLSNLAEAKKFKIVQPKKETKKNISDDADEHMELCAVKFEDPSSQSNQSKVGKKNVKKSTPPESSFFEPTKVELDDLEESGIILDQHISSNTQKDLGQDSSSNSKKLVEDVNIEESKKKLHNYLNSTPKGKCDDTRGQLPVQRCIDFNKKSDEKLKADYDSYDADSIVTIANTPLSPISSGIASPINSKGSVCDYKSAMEIDAYCAGIIYLLKLIDMPRIVVNKPDDLDLLLRKNANDPRLFKYLKKNTNAVQISSSLCAYNKATTQNDPRRASSIYNTESYINLRPQQQEAPQQTPNMLLYGCLQRSPWYQSLMSTMKIQINQTISVLVRAINNFQKIRLEDPYAVFDIFKIYCAGELLEILENLGLFVDVNGVIAEKKNISSYAGRSYGCSSVVNATYSFIQPVEPPTVTVQHQQMRSFTAPTQNFSTPATTFPTQAPFISCYIDSPQMAIEKPIQIQQPQQHQPQQHQSQQKKHYQQRAPSPMSRPAKQPRAPYPSSAPRRHCGLKVPYSYSAPPPAPAKSPSPSPRSSVSPVKRQARCSDSEEESWD